MARILVVFNPRADRGRAERAAAGLYTLVEERGGADWVRTVRPDHATEIAAHAAADGYDVVVALGGDGTVHEIVNGLMSVEPAARPGLGIVPIGSGNDFAFGAGLLRPPAEAIGRIFAGESRPVDVGTLRDENGRVRYWINTVGIGFDAAVAIQATAMGHLRGFWMYLVATLEVLALKYDVPCLELRWDGGHVAQPMVMLTIGNGPREGGGFVTTPHSRVDDGVLEFLYAGDLSRLKILGLLPHVMKGTHGGSPDVHFGQATALHVEADRPIPIHADGELFATRATGVRRICIEIIPGAIRLLR